MEMILTPATVNGKELQRLNLVSQAAQSEEVLPAAIACAHMNASRSAPVRPPR
jgi:enoyl-CoA hydratase/carnithine racemase